MSSLSLLAPAPGKGKEKEKEKTGTNGAKKDVSKQAVVSSSSSSSQPRENSNRVFTHASGIAIKIQNVVATMNLGIPKLDLMKIASQTRNAEFNPHRFAAIIMRIREPKSTALIFESGKIVVTGAKGEEQAKRAAIRFKTILDKLGFKAQDNKKLDFKVQNIVGSCDCKFAIRLEGLALAHGKFASYEPELFPGLIYRMVKPKIVLLIFVSGKVVLTGAKYKTDIHEAFDKIYPVLLEFKKK